MWRPGFQLALVAMLAAACGKESPRTGGGTAPLPELRETVPARPNILLIVADDLGYTDIGAYGGEIETPHLDALASEGVTFSQFYASPMCSPSRAMLLTGLDHHRVGLGNLAARLAENQRGRPGYEGRLNAAAVTLPELLSGLGYRTYLSGKWHLGSGGGAEPGARGFDRHFALHDSGASHFADMMSVSGPEKVLYTDDGEPVERLPEDFYSSRYYTDRLIEFLNEDGGDTRPFFAYLSYTAPHFPLQAPAATIAKYQGRYDDGYDVLHRRRLERAQALGLVADDVTAFPGIERGRSWTDLSAAERAVQSRVMEIYAAMIDDMDANIGRLLGYLRDRGELGNTAIVFLSDNGAEGHRLEHGLGPLYAWSRECCDNSPANMGRAGSYVMLGPHWARASMAPFRMFKGFTSEGGIRVPAIVRYPRRFAGGRTFTGIATIRDVMPTVLELAASDGEQPGGWQPPAGGDARSLVPILAGRERRVHATDAVFGWELLGKRALRRGDWKIVRESGFVDWWDSEALGIRREAWQLYNLAEDPAELRDLSAERPERLEDMVERWADYAEANGVILPETARGY